MIKIDFITKPKEIEHKYIVDKYGLKCTYDENGEFHSYYGQPSVEHPNGFKYWHKHGICIRFDNPKTNEVISIL